MYTQLEYSIYSSNFLDISIYSSDVNSTYLTDIYAKEAF